MADRYKLDVKSKEQRGATQPNIVDLGFASDDDALTFRSNLDLCVSGHVATVDKVLSQNYALPYPAGSGISCRIAFRDDAAHEWQCRIQNVKDKETAAGLPAVLIALGIACPTGTMPLATNGVPTVFEPQAFLG